MHTEITPKNASNGLDLKNIFFKYKKVNKK